MKTTLAAVLLLTLSFGCSQDKTHSHDCCGPEGGPCCVEAKKECPSDCDKACCADKGEAKTCPVSCTKACCADKKAE